LDGVLTAEGIDNVAMPTPGLFTFDWFFEKHKEYHVTIKGTEDAGVAASVFSLFNGSVGASTLGMPLAMSLMGWGIGLFASVIIAITGWLTSRMLIRVCAAKGCRSYDKAIELVLGSRALHVFQAFMMLSTMGSLIAYMILIGDFAVMLLRPSEVTKSSSSQGVRQVAILLGAVVIILPLSLMRRVTSLVFVSLLSVVFVFILGIVLTIEASTDPLLPSFEAVHTSVPDFFRGLPILVLAFSNQTSVMPVFREMKEALRTPRGFDIVCGITNGLVFLLYALVG
jgi:amino acid permease